MKNVNKCINVIVIFQEIYNILGFANFPVLVTVFILRLQLLH